MDTVFYIFGDENSTAEEIKRLEAEYLNRLLEKFTEFMEENNYNMNHLL